MGATSSARTTRFVTHVLVTNDFPPKMGGIQNYLWELWRRLPEGRARVLTTTHPDAAPFDAAQPFPVERADRVLLPTPWVLRRVQRAARDADLVLLDPVLPLGLLGRHIGRPYGVIVHGAELAIPARAPGPREAVRSVLRGARLIIAA
ncbi:MAG: phosphatidyl-myo-inositol dimannoside synthase, partial [Actinomycetota bacterium]